MRLWTEAGVQDLATLKPLSLTEGVDLSAVDFWLGKTFVNVQTNIFRWTARPTGGRHFSRVTLQDFMS